MTPSEQQISLPSFRWTRDGSTWWVAFLSFAWLSATTGLYPLLLPDEGRYVGVAWSMLSSDQLWVPRLDGLPFFHKPPLFYWLTALSLQLFGVNEWAARLCSVMSGVASVALLFWFLKTHANLLTAWLAAIILLSMPLLFGASHYANLDMTVAGVITASIVSGATAVLRYERGKPYRWVLALAYILAGAGFLAKGLIGCVLPGGVLFFWLLGRRQFGTMRRMLWLPGLLLFALISLPWMLAMQQRYPDFFDYYIVHQHFERFLEGGFNNARPFWFYVPVLLGLSLPWSAQLWRLCRRSYWRNDPDAQIRGLMVSWLLVVLIFFSIPNSKLIGYILPATAPLAYFIATTFAQRWMGEDGARARKTFFWSLTISLAICVIAVFIMVFRPQPSTKSLALKLQSHYSASDQIVMLGSYRFDLDFYLRSGKHVFVVSDWNDPDIQNTDNWRRELSDAARFEPDAGKQVLLGRGQLLDKLCAPREVDLWLVGDAESPEHFPYLRARMPEVQDGKLRVWHVPADAVLDACRSAPARGLGVTRGR